MRGNWAIRSVLVLAFGNGGDAAVPDSLTCHAGRIAAVDASAGESLLVLRAS